MNRVQIKICGLTNMEDAQACSECGADMIGLNFFAESRRYVRPEMAREIVEHLSSAVEAVGVFVDAAADEVRDIAALVNLHSIQLHGHASPETCLELAKDFRVIRAFQTNQDFQPKDLAPFRECDVLLDADHPHLRGGTGTTCDWSIAKSARQFARFLFLSGGLNPQNVRDAISTVAPDAVDFCSGVERAPGLKDRHAIKNLIEAVRRA